MLARSQLLFTGQVRMLREVSPADSRRIAQWLLPPHHETSLVGPVVTNLESAIAHDQSQSFQPKVLDHIEAMGFNLVTLSNNHAGELGSENVQETITLLNRRKLSFAGMGQNVSEAAQATLVKTAHTSFALIAMASGALSCSAVAGEAQAGVHSIDIEDHGEVIAADAARVLNAIKEARRHADHVILYHHNHYCSAPNKGPREPRYERATLARYGVKRLPQQAPRWLETWARRCLDAGADAYFIDGVPLVRGIELYTGNKAIFYGLGNFLFHSKKPVSAWDPWAFRSLVAQLSFSDGKLTGIKLRPIVISTANDRSNGLPRPALPAEAEEILQRLRAGCARYGTKIRKLDQEFELVFASSQEPNTTR